MNKYLVFHRNSGRCVTCGADTLWGDAPHADDCPAANMVRIKDVVRYYEELVRWEDVLDLTEDQRAQLVGAIKLLYWLISGAEPLILTDKQLLKFANEKLQEWEKRTNGNEHRS